MTSFVVIKTNCFLSSIVITGTNQRSIISQYNQHSGMYRKVSSYELKTHIDVSPHIDVAFEYF